MKSKIFIGRDNTLNHLKFNFKKLLEGNGHAIFISGSPGIGKSTVVNHFLESFNDSSKLKATNSKPSFYILKAKCNDIITTGNPYAPFAELLDNLINLGTKECKKAFLDWAKDLGPKILEGIVPYLGPMLGKILEKQFEKHGQDIQNKTVFLSGHTYSFLQLFEKISKLVPLIIFIDDLHWADESSINLIFSLSRRIIEIPILLIACYRPCEIVEKADHKPHPLSKVLLEMQYYSISNEILLEQFKQNEIRIFLNKSYPNNHFPLSLTESLYNKTNGIPFFVDLVVQLLKDKEFIFQDSNSVWQAKNLKKIPIPKEILAIIKIRIKNLEDPSQRILSWASILGEQFHSKVLASTLKIDHLKILEILRHLEDDFDLVRYLPNTSPSNLLHPNWEFKHFFVQQVLYDSLTNDERIEIHNLIVNTLKSYVPDNQDELTNELAYHCEKAIRYSEAASYRMTAAQRANKSWSWAELAFNCERGILDIDLIGIDQDKLYERTIFYSGLVYAYRRSMKLEMVKKAACKLIQLAHKCRDTMAEIEGYIGLLDTAGLRGDGNKIHEYFLQLWHVARNAREKHHMIRVVGYLQHMNTILGIYKFIPDHMKQYLDETIDFCQKEKFSILYALALQARGAIAFFENENQYAINFFNEAIKIAKKLNKADERFSQEYFFSSNFFTNEIIVTNCIEYIGRIYRRQGKWNKAISELKRVYVIKESEKNLPGMAGLLNVIAETQLLSGSFMDANLNFKKCWKIALKTELSELKAMILSTGISIALALNDYTEVENRLQLFEYLPYDKNIVWIWHKKQITLGILNIHLYKKFDIAENFLAIGLKNALKDHNAGLIAQYHIHLSELNLFKKNLTQAQHYAYLALENAEKNKLRELGETYTISAIVKEKQHPDEAAELFQKAINFFKNKNILHKATFAQNLKNNLLKPG